MAMKQLFLILFFILLVACSELEPKPPEPSSAHIQAEEPPVGEIPQLVEQLPILPEPTMPEELEKYTVVVNEVPVRELLFALARDAKINVDIASDISGPVTINAVDQTLPQILDRLSKQVDLRYVFDGDNLIITPDTPYIHTYTIDYVNMARTTTSSNTVSTQIASTSSGESGESAGGGGNTSTTDVSSTSGHYFWSTLVANVSAILGEEVGTVNATSVPITNSVIPAPESGLLTVRATSSQHKEVQKFIDDLLGNAKRQVLIQATIAEVTLSDQYQAGIDWSFLQDTAFDIVTTGIGGLPALTGNLVSSFVLDYTDADTGGNAIAVGVDLLDQFGDTNVLSSPQLMVLNNQTALLKVVDNVVYFEIDAETTAGALGAAPVTTVDTTARTVPVGIVMSVTPQISGSDEILLNVRPTISRVISFVNDPNPDIAAAGTTNPVPQIQVREMESMLRLTNGQIGVLGGLMQDDNRSTKRGVPGAVDTPFLSDISSATNKEYFKTELVIFLRPVIIRSPSLDDDLKQYKPFLNPARYQKTSAENE